MANFDIVVDTEPMAASVDGVSEHLALTTGAVVAMQTAVIASEREAAKKICKNVDKGFFSLIQSQMSMKLSACFTEAQAKIALLNEHRKTLERTQSRMEADYNRVKGQYRQIFKGLDKALSARIAQLDKDAVAMADARKRVILSMFERHVPETVVSSNEVCATEQVLVASRLKEKAGNSLSFLANKVGENLAYKSLMDSMLDRITTEVRHDEYIPVVYANKQSNVSADSYVLTLHFPEYLSEQTKNTISLTILNQNEVCTGQKDDHEIEAFQALVASSSLSPRVAEQMMDLFQMGGC